VVVTSIDLDHEVLASADAVVLLTPHTNVDYDRIIRGARLVVDTHSGLQPREAPNVVNVWLPENVEAGVLA
jgi:UDP-N-acetyl-D-mannosaminuronate dehydrogenase